jgi:hypothetical protein
MPIIGTLPAVIANAQPIDAVPVMADFNWIVSQVNANAAPAGSAGEWTSPGVSPSFISATQFSVPGDLRTTFTTKRRVLLTVTAVNGGATVTNQSFGAGNTTVTVITDTTGFLTAGLTAVSYGFFDSTILSTPKKTNIMAQVSGSVNVASNTLYVVGGSVPFVAAGTFGDDFGEYSAGIFTFKTPGRYLLTGWVGFTISGAAVTVNAGVAIPCSGSSFFNGGPTLPYNTAVSSQHIIPFSGMIFIAAAGDTATVKVTSPTFTGGPMQSVGAVFSVSQQF